MNRRKSPLERLLAVRTTEVSAARASLGHAMAQVANAQALVADAKTAHGTAEADLRSYAEQTATERAGGFTIADRMLHADGERALRHQADHAQVQLAVAHADLERLEAVADSAREVYVAAQRDAELVERRAAAQSAEVAAVQRRREEDDALDAVLARQRRSDRDTEG